MSNRHKASIHQPGGVFPETLRSLVLLAALLLTLLSSACDEWDKYWQEQEAPPADPDLTPPVVQITAPSGADSAHATPVSGSDYGVQILAEDDRGIQRIELYVDGDLESTLTTEPYTYPWDTTPLAEASMHGLWAEAFDAAGNSTTSDTTYAQVFNAGPEVVLTAPEDSAFASGIVAMAAAPVDPGAEIARVDFLVDGETADSAFVPPYETTLDTNTLENGVHVLTAKATGPTEQVRVSPPVRILVNRDSPTVTITFPSPFYPGLSPGGTMPFSVSAIDAVQGELGGESVTWESDLDGPLGTGSYLRYQGLTPDASHRITATATNGWGVSDSDSVDLLVRDAPTYDYFSYVYGGLIEPLCLECHIPGNAEYDQSYLDMTSYEGLMAGGINQELYPNIVPGKPDSSLMYNKVWFEFPWVGERMPPQDQFPPLTPQEMEWIRVWIEEGAAP